MGELQRDAFIAALRQRGVDARPYFYPMSAMPYFEDADTPVAHEVFAKGINLPTYYDLTEEDVCEISRTVSSVWLEHISTRQRGEFSARGT